MFDFIHHLTGVFSASGSTFSGLNLTPMGWSYHLPSFLERISQVASTEMSVSRLRIFLELSIDRYFAFLIQNPRNLHIMAWEAAEGWHTFVGDTKELEEHRSRMICLGDFLHPRDAQRDKLISEVVLKPCFVTLLFPEDRSQVSGHISRCSPSLCYT